MKKLASQAVIFFVVVIAHCFEQCDLRVAYASFLILLYNYLIMGLDLNFNRD